MNGKVKHSQADSKVLQERNFKVYSGSRTQVYTPCFKGRFRENGGGGRHRVFKRKRSGEGITYRQQNIKDCQLTANDGEDPKNITESYGGGGGKGGIR